LITFVVSIPLALSWFFIVDAGDTLLKRIVDSAAIFVGIVGGTQVIVNVVLTERPHQRMWRWILTKGSGLRYFLIRRLLPAPELPEVSNGIEAFIGRDDELALLQEKLSKLIRSPFAICFYGFGGVGKTRLLTEFANRIARERFGVTPRYKPVPRVSLGNNQERAGETLPGYLSRLFHIPESDSPDQFDKLEKLIPYLDNSIVLIDEFPYDDSEFTAHFEWLLRQIAAKNRYRILFVTASRGAPKLPTTSPAQMRELRGLDKEQLLRYVAEYHLSNLGVQKDILDDFDNFYQFTDGNPQVTKLILANPMSWNIIRTRKRGERIAEIEELDRLLNEIWSSIKDQEIQDALRILTVVSQLNIEWPEQVAKDIVPNWITIKNDLQRRGLLNRAPEGKYKIHDLLAEFIYENIPHLASYHILVGKYYLNLGDPSYAVMAAQHAILAGDISLLQLAYPQMSQYLFRKGEARIFEQLLNRSKPLIEDSQDELFRAITTRDQAKALLNLGETAEALEEYERAKQLFAEHDLFSKKEEAELLMGMADCYRLRGKVKAAREHFQQAVELFRSAGLEDKAVAADIELGHSYFLTGEMTESLKVYDRILATLDEKKHPGLMADLYYRRSKSHRLLGSYDLAITEARKAWNLYEAIGSEVGVGKARWTIAGVLRMQGEYRKALEECHQVKRIFDMTGYRATTFLQHDYAEIYRALKDFEKAQEIYQMTMERTLATGERNRYAHSVLGTIESSRWQRQSNEPAKIPDIDIGVYDQVLSIYQEMGVKWGVVVCLACRALARLTIWELAQRDLVAALKVIENESMPVEKQFIETIITDRKPILFPLNWI
jgi:tetratricopeptide (TPR) repeat protein